MNTNDQIGNIALTRPDGSQTSLAHYRGKVLLVVNVASKCGLTPQYAGMEKMYQDRQAEGLVILGFPTGNFREQEFDTDQEIAQFCAMNYGVSFPILSKISVAGDDQHALYTNLIAALPLATGAEEFRQKMQQHKVSLAPAPDILWNFEKFLLNREGQVVARFAPDVEVGDARIVAAIEAALAQPSV